MSSQTPKDKSGIWECPDCGEMHELEVKTCPDCRYEAQEPQYFEMSWYDFWKECEDLKH